MNGIFETWGSIRAGSIDHNWPFSAQSSGNFTLFIVPIPLFDFPDDNLAVDTFISVTRLDSKVDDPSAFSSWSVSPESGGGTISLTVSNLFVDRIELQYRVVVYNPTM